MMRYMLAAYCVPYLHNLLTLSYYQGSKLCTLPTQYAPEYHNTTEVAYCVPCLHNMLQLS